jgi:predicted dehydrogenase
MSLAAAEAGKHVRVEKPMAVTDADADADAVIATATAPRRGVARGERWAAHTGQP